MKPFFSHIGEAFEEIKKIYDALPQSCNQRIVLKTFAVKLAALNGEWQNLEFYWPKVTRGLFNKFYKPDGKTVRSLPAGENE